MAKWMIIGVVLLLSAFVGVAFLLSSGVTYTLYRTSVSAVGSRLHVATFDVNENEAYNQENCQIAAGLFANQPGVKVKYWCEKGAYRP